MQLPTIYDIRTGMRRLVSMGSVVLPRETGVRAERWFRGYEDKKKLENADGVIVSFGKSGRTWLRVLIWRYFAKKNGFAADGISEFDEFRLKNPNVPVLFFTHDNYLKDFVGHDRKADLYGDARVVLLLRDPRDTAVSQFFQWKHRIVPRKKVLNNYPLGDIDLHGFITSEQSGIPKIIDFMNAWAREMKQMPNLLVVKYEDLRADTKNELRRVLSFFGQQPSEEELDDAVSFASVENMRRMELENASKAGAHRSLKPADASDPSSFKVRRAKVGGWRDYVTEEQSDAIDKMVKEKLDPVFGYV
ncbi:MAG: sulfotransferase domain-containing protein [Aestuariivirga sp.]|nr:sulfotransferase domain-containing protein [Aestuariivirga sp.]